MDMFPIRKGGVNHKSGKGGGKGSQDVTIKSLQQTIAALSTKFDKFSIPDESSGSSNRSNSALTPQSKKNNKRS
jgi:hypothetical protein